MSEAKIKALMVEDLEVAQVVAFNIFKKLDYHLHIVTNGVTALEQVLREHYDIIFVDLQLPDINGYELAKTIRTIERRYPRMPLIAVTANSDPNLKIETENAGFDDYLLKPLTLEAVRHITFKHVNKNKNCAKNLDAA